jgi:hypothetical protein
VLRERRGKKQRKRKEEKKERGKMSNFERNERRITYSIIVESRRPNNDPNRWHREVCAEHHPMM